MSKKYTLEELKVGMVVGYDELSEIYDKLIILVDTYKKDGQTVGRIEYIGDDVPSNIREIRENTRSTASIFRDSKEELGEVDYDE